MNAGGQTPDIFYDRALAWIHDQYYGQIARDASVAILRLLQGGDPAGQLVVDLGCGTGILASALSDNGYDVLGVDVSQAMLEIATRCSPKARFVQASLFHFFIPHCKAVVAIGEPISYLSGEKNENHAVRNLFWHIHEQLEHGGSFVFDILTTEAEEGGQTRIVEREDMTMFIHISIDPGSRVLTREMTFFTWEGYGYAKHREIHRQQLYNRKDIETLLSETGFRFTAVDRYDAQPFRTGHMGFICRK